MRSKQFGFWFILLVVATVVVIISIRVWNSDGLWLGGLTLFIGVGGNIWATYLLKCADGKSTSRERITLLMLTILLLLSTWQVFRSTIQRVRLVELNRILKTVFATLSPDYFTLENIASKEKAIPTEKLLQFQKWIEDGKESVLRRNFWTLN